MIDYAKLFEAVRRSPAYIHYTVQTGDGVWRPKSKKNNTSPLALSIYGWKDHESGESKKLVDIARDIGLNLADYESGLNGGDNHAKPPTPEKKREPPDSKYERARTDASAIRRYFASRAIDEITDDLIQACGLRLGDEYGKPVILTPIRSPTGQIVQLNRIYIDSECRKISKKLYYSYPSGDRGLLIPGDKSTGRLVIFEGLEDAICFRLHSSDPSDLLVCFGTAGFTRISAFFADYEVIIAICDPDTADAAIKARDKLPPQVIRLVPSNPATDGNDALIAGRYLEWYHGLVEISRPVAKKTAPNPDTPPQPDSIQPAPKTETTPDSLSESQQEPPDWFIAQQQQSQELGEQMDLPPLNTGGGTGDVIVDELNTKHALIDIQGKLLILNHTRDPVNGRGEITLSSEADFHRRYSNRKIDVNDKPISVSRYWMRSRYRTQYDGLVFDPSGRQHDGYYNLWRGFAVEPREGNCSLYYQHISEVITGGSVELYDYVLDWMADAVQNPSVLPGVAIVLRGGQGAGKGTMISLFGELFGRHYLHVSNPAHVIGQFNSHLKDCLILFADEAFFAGDKKHESVIKTLITENKRIIEFKGKDAIQLPNYTRLMLASNKSWVVPIDIDDRRFFVVDVDKRHARDRAYFSAIYRQMREQGGLQALLYDLQHRDLSKANLSDIPSTKAKNDTKFRSLDSVTSWLVYSVANETVGFSDIAIDDLYTQYVDECRTRRAETKNAWSRQLHKIIPGLSRRRFSGGKRFYAMPTNDVLKQLVEDYVGFDFSWDEL
jgi:hypothetical protein